VAAAQAMVSYDGFFPNLKKTLLITFFLLRDESLLILRRRPSSFENKTDVNLPIRA
jgi:hypothetical protein